MASRTVSARVVVEGEQKYKQSMANLAESNKSLGSSAGNLGDQITDLSGKMGISLPDGATKALSGLKGFSTGTMAAMGAAAAAVTALIKVTKELHQMTVQAAADADELITMSMVTGLGTDTLQQLNYAANLIDVPVSTITSSLSKLTRTMYEAQSGNAAAQASFEALGVSYQNADGTLRGAYDTFIDLVDALGQVENPAERDALVMDIMGKSAQELNPLILQGSDALRELAEEAEETGYVLDESQIKKLGEVDDAYQRMQLQVEAAKKEIAVEFAPTSQRAMEAFGDFVETAGKRLVDSGIVQNLGALVESTVGFLEAGTALIDTLPSWANPINGLSTDLKGLAIIMATVADAATILAGLMPWNWGSGMLKQGLGMGETESNLHRIINHDVDNSDWVTYSGHNAAGNDNWRGGLTYLNEAGPEAVFLPNGTRILNAQDTRNMMGGDTYNINVANIEELQQVLDLIDGLRVRRRMA